MAAPDISVSLPQELGVITCPELYIDPEICDQVSCDDTGGRLVLPVLYNWVGDRHSCLLDWQVGDTLCWYFGRSPLEKVCD